MDYDRVCHNGFLGMGCFVLMIRILRRGMGFWKLLYLWAAVQIEPLDRRCDQVRSWRRCLPVYALSCNRQQSQSPTGSRPSQPACWLLPPPWKPGVCPVLVSGLITLFKWGIRLWVKDFGLQDGWQKNTKRRIFSQPRQKDLQWTSCYNTQSRRWSNS